MRDANSSYLYRKQYEISVDRCDTMRTRALAGPVTSGVTFAGSASVPVARSYPDTVLVETPGRHEVPFVGWRNPLRGTVDVQTPFSGAGLWQRGQRWSLNEQDMLPAFQLLLDDQTDQVRELLEQPVAERIEEYQLEDRWRDIGAQRFDGDVREVRQ